LSGKLVGPTGAAIAREWVRLERDGASFESASNRPLMFNTRADGSFDYRALQPGKWTLSAAITGCAEWRSEFVLAALESKTADVQLSAVAPEMLARIEGTIESKSGSYKGRVTVAIYPAGTHAGTVAKVEWSESDGRRRGRFTADGLKPGKYRLDARAAGLLAIEPREIEVETGGEPVRFVVRDDVETVSWHVRAFADDRTDRVVPRHARSGRARDFGRRETGTGRARISAARCDVRVRGARGRLRAVLRRTGDRRRHDC
jgi:hypothetical protein